MASSPRLAADERFLMSWLSLRHVRPSPGRDSARWAACPVQQELDGLVVRGGRGEVQCSVTRFVAAELTSMGTHDGEDRGFIANGCGFED